jgi:hypothetical protein
MRDDEPSQIHDPRCRAKEGSTVVSTVKDTRALTSAITDHRSPNAERRTPNAERRTPNAERRTPFVLKKTS